jgi:hypothetical protein
MMRPGGMQPASRTPPASLLAFITLAAGCSGSRAPGGAVDGAAADAGADLAADAPATSQPDAGDDDAGAADASSAPAPPTALVAYERFLAARTDAYQARWAECFGVPRAGLTPGAQQARDPAERLRASFRLGLVLFDERAAATCLTGIAAASCEQVAEMHARAELEAPGDRLPGCLAALTGTIAQGQPCLQSADCRDRSHRCGAEGGGRCQTCRPTVGALPIGADCSSGAPCPTGSRCRLAAAGAPSLQCELPSGRGGFCNSDTDCAPGLFCSRTVAFEFGGSCQPHRAGEPCDGDWQCIAFLACVGAGPGTPGRCGQPRRAGEPCQLVLDARNQASHSDCAVGLTCVDLDGQGPRCLAGAGLGEPCGEVPTPGGVRRGLGCVAGFCERPPGQPSGRCRPPRGPGERCQTDAECSPLACGDATAPDQPRTCRPPAAAGTINQPCRAIDETCAEGLFCRVLDVESPALIGSCQPLRRVGAACQELDRCEPLSVCVTGVCTRC